MLQDKIYNTIKERALINKGDIVLVAASGGIDSTALIYILREMSKKLGIRVHVAHLDHKLRGKESEMDAQFVASLCIKLNIPFTIERLDVALYAKQNKLGIEEAARNVRYDFLETTAKNVGANKIAVAHTADDNVETFLMRLLRGTGSRGLEGIPAKRGIIIRPLLDVHRSELEDYLKKLKVKARTDSSNFDTKFTRNKIRHDLIPILKGCNPAFKEAVIRTIRSVSLEQAYLQEIAQDYTKKIVKSEASGVSIDIKKFNKIHNAIKAQILRIAIDRVKGDLVDVSSVNIDDINKIVGSKRAEVHLSGIVVSANKGRLFILKGKASKRTLKDFKLGVKVPGKTDVHVAGFSISTRVIPRASVKGLINIDPLYALIDKSSVTGKLFVRNRKAGDRYIPLGLAGSKKLSDILVDMKVDLDERDKLPLICDKKGIVWVAGCRLADRCKITKGTKEVVELKAQKL